MWSPWNPTCDQAYTGLLNDPAAPYGSTFTQGPFNCFAVPPAIQVVNPIVGTKILIRDFDQVGQVAYGSTYTATLEADMEAAGYSPEQIQRARDIAFQAARQDEYFWNRFANLETVQRCHFRYRTRFRDALVDQFLFVAAGQAFSDDTVSDSGSKWVAWLSHYRPEEESDFLAEVTAGDVIFWESEICPLDIGSSVRRSPQIISGPLVMTRTVEEHTEECSAMPWWL